MANQEIEMMKVGDQLQSAASRLAEYAREQAASLGTPYEVHMAALEAEQAVHEWTRIRRKTVRPHAGV